MKRSTDWHDTKGIRLFSGAYPFLSKTLLSGSKPNSVLDIKNMSFELPIQGRIDPMKAF
jgi:hypothetical protein